MFKLVLEKAEEPEIKLPTSTGSWKKEESSRKTISVLLTMANLPYDPATPLLGIYPENHTIVKDTLTPVFIVALFTIARAWKQLRCPLT